MTTNSASMNRSMLCWIAKTASRCLLDRGRMVIYTHGFGISPYQLEPLSVELGGAQCRPWTELADVIGGVVKKARTETIMAMVVFFVIIWVIMTTGITAVWRMEEVRRFGLEMLPPAIVVGLLVVYFDWRAKLLSRIRDERNEHQKAA